jgi:hypothetical protein
VSFFLNSFQKIIPSFSPAIFPSTWESTWHCFHIDKKFVRRLKGPVHISVKQRWDANADDCWRQSKPLIRLLESVDNDWARIKLVS